MLAEASATLRDGGWLWPAQVFDGAQLTSGRVIRRLASGQFECMDRAALPQAAPVHPFAGIAAPGFVDLQVNGGGGVLFNADPTPDGICAIVAAHRRGGTGRMLPTLITDAPAVMDRAVSAILEVRGEPGVAGMHIEGPHISPLRRGTHRAAFIRPFDTTTDRQIDRLRDAGVPVVLTVAPEVMAPGQIASLVNRGVVVSLGHSAATYGQTQAALCEGAQTFTHLMNAMPPLESRNPGIVGAALNADAYCSVIFDGLHVVPEMLQIILNARRHAGRIIAVTDAMPTVFGPDRFTLYDMDVSLIEGKLINPEGSLAGAHVSMLASLRLMVQMLGVPLQTALQSHITHPCRLMGLDPGFASGAGLVLIEPDLGDCRLIGPN